MARTHIRFPIFLLAVAVLMPGVDRFGTAGEPPKQKPPDIYDRTADGARQIAEALQIAERDNKRVLLQFGANWCVWCHRLHDVFKNDKAVARALLYEYVLVLIDVDMVDGKRHNAAIDERYGHPTKQGLPVLVVLDADGRQLNTQETASLEVGDGHDPKKVLEFLHKWKPEPLAADRVLSAGLAQAKAESKNVFLHFSAPWCAWCHKLDAYLRGPKVAPVLTSAYVPVKIDVDRMTGGKEMDAKYRAGQGEGIPFFVFLDPNGVKLADSNSPDGNVGYPQAEAEVSHFLKAVRATAPRLDSDQLAILESGLKNSG